MSKKSFKNGPIFQLHENAIFVVSLNEVKKEFKKGIFVVQLEDVENNGPAYCLLLGENHSHLRHP
jgi:hypothetical protein